MKSSLDVNYVRINGINIRYIDQNQNREPVLFIHGLGGSIESWNYNIGPMSSRNLRIVALDLPGFGLSDSPKINYSINFYSEYVVKFLQTIGIDRNISIIGSSLGGQIGAEIAIKNNVPVTKLVLISPAGVPPKSFKGTPTLRRYLSILQAKSFEELKNILTSLADGPVKESYAKIIFERLSRPGAKEAFVSALKESSRAPRFTKNIRKSSAKIFVLWGREDKMIPLKFIRPFVKQSNCRILIIEHCGHRPHVSHSRLFNSTVYNFIRE